VFWKLAMYADDLLFIENDFCRYSVGSTTDELKSNSDGSSYTLKTTSGRYFDLAAGVDGTFQFDDEVLWSAAIDVGWFV
jgi:hypothetical protein